MNVSECSGFFAYLEGLTVWWGYKTKRWTHLRAKALRRDGYKCREAARFGKHVEATTVHHIWPAEDYPEYAWELWNLLSVSASAHDALHDRFTGKLTAKGEYWRRKISPPTPWGSNISGLLAGGGGLSDGEKTGEGGQGAGENEFWP